MDFFYKFIDCFLLFYFIFLFYNKMGVAFAIRLRSKILVYTKNIHLLKKICLILTELPP